MRWFLILLFIPIALSDLHQREWELFKIRYKKQYESIAEERRRYKIYLQNRHEINTHNKLYKQGKVSFYLGMNHFGDLLLEEWRRKVIGFNETKLRKGKEFVPPENVIIPHEMNWGWLGAVTPTKDQGMCSSSWAFSTTGALEGQNFRVTGKLVSLSEQNLIDCTSGYGNRGCEGGNMDISFEYIRDNGGINPEGSYKYEGKEGKCRYEKRNGTVKDIGYIDIPTGDEWKLAQAVAAVGPIAAAMDGSHRGFRFYRGGILNCWECRRYINHAVLIIGYGFDNRTRLPYWFVKNSWGVRWGINGYFQITRNRNCCGIALLASYPLVSRVDKELLECTWNVVYINSQNRKVVNMKNSK